MFMFQRYRVAQTQRAVVSRFGKFERVLEPGQYWLFTLGLRVHYFSARRVFEGRVADYLIDRYPDVMREHFDTFTTDEDEFAYVYVDGTFERVQPPGQVSYYWPGGCLVVGYWVKISGEEWPAPAPAWGEQPGAKEWVV
ncbi:MAG: hypothetical protein FJW40_25835 [Acidobacteria bacterium]|nr:hypothetical protein [Acidobacteriota bacterium]